MNLISDSDIVCPGMYIKNNHIHLHWKRDNKIKTGHIGIELEQQAAFEKAKMLVKQIKALGIS